MVCMMKELVRTKDGIQPDSSSVRKQGGGQGKNADFKDSVSIYRECETGVGGIDEDIVFNDGVTKCLNGVYQRQTWKTAMKTEVRRARLNSNRSSRSDLVPMTSQIYYCKERKRESSTTHLVPMTRGQDEGLGVNYLAYIQLYTENWDRSGVQ